MTTILIVIFACWMLYKVGAVGVFLNACKLQEETPGETLETYYTAPPITEREQLERQAAVIVAAMGEDSRTVAYMSEGLLRALINDYTQANK